MKMIVWKAPRFLSPLLKKLFSGGDAAGGQCKK